MSDLQDALEDAEFVKLILYNNNLDATWKRVEQYIKAARLVANPNNDWPIVDRMASAMRERLEANRHKGLDGWLNEETTWLILRLKEELDEFAANPTWQEAADVANFAAMVAEVAAAFTPLGDPK